VKDARAIRTEYIDLSEPSTEAMELLGWRQFFKIVRKKRADGQLMMLVRLSDQGKRPHRHKEGRRGH